MQTISAEIDDSVGIITLSRPKALNAINTEMVAELESTLVLWQDKGLRALIITGEGKAFAAGADISQMSSFSAVEAEMFARRGQRSLRLIEHFPAPTIAAVNGFALGGGCELAMCCDLILAGERLYKKAIALQLSIRDNKGRRRSLEHIHMLYEHCGRQDASRKVDNFLELLGTT